MIPKVFHFIWFGGDLPEAFAGYIDTWRERHQNWAFNLWSEDDLFLLNNQDLFDRAEEIAPGSEGQFKADLARYEILCRYGGVYVDVDMECRRPIDDLIRGHDCFAAWETNGHWINNAILGATPAHPLLIRLIKDLPLSVVNRAAKDRPNVISGPQFLTPRWNKSDEVTIFPKGLFYPYLWHELDRDGEPFPDSYAVHHWNNARRRREHARH